MATIACFVSAHGFGHAARACAVMNGMSRLRNDLRFEIITTVPHWFFAQSLRADFALHHVITDVGLVQRTAIEEDLEATVRRLDDLLAPETQTVERLTATIDGLSCELVMCDIAPLGLALAARLGLPSVLLENFTWDWIYGGYANAPTGLAEHSVRLAEMFRSADLHIQTEPVCDRSPNAHQVAPVSRCPRMQPTSVRDCLGVPGDASLVLLSMGGVRWTYRSLDVVHSFGGAWFVVPGGDDAPRREENLITLPFHSEFYHPDLVHAADVVVGKLGYSTVAETYSAGAAMAYLGRPGFRESGVLEEFVTTELNACALGKDAFNSGAWLGHLDELLTNSRRPEPRESGANHAAKLILDRFSLR